MRTNENAMSLDPRLGLHTLGAWAQKSYLADQCVELASNLDEAISATAKAAPIRAPKFLLNNSASRTQLMDMDPSQTERILERKLFDRFGPDGLSTSVSGIWNRIIDYQIPLYDESAKNGWGAIDLLAITEEQRPAIVELKIGSSRESVLRPVIEAASYAVALRQNWNALIGEMSTFGQCALDVESLRNASDPIPLIMIAPEEYWERATDLSRVEPRGRLKGYWSDYRCLLSGLEERGFPVVFASIGNADGVASDMQVARCKSFPPNT